MNIRQRHDAIVRSLRRNGTSTVAELAEEVGTSRRTLLRDIAALRDEGFVIHSESGRGGGVQLDPQSMQTTARLSVAEVFALLISVAAVRAAQNLPFSDLADAGLAKIERALPSDKVRDLRRFLACLHIGQLSPKQDLSDLGTIDPALLPAFEKAFLARQHLRFEYRDAKGARSLRMSSRRPCSSCNRSGILSHGIRRAKISGTSAWIASQALSLSAARPSGAGMCPLKKMFVPTTTCRADPQNRATLRRAHITLNIRGFRNEGAAAPQACPALKTAFRAKGKPQKPRIRCVRTKGPRCGTL